LFQAKALVSKGMSPPQAALKTGVKFKQNEFLQQLNRLSLDQLGWVLSELGRIDFGMKTGQTSAPIAIERLVLKLFSMQKSA
jgi:DNA polymerase III delta subunit